MLKHALVGSALYLVTRDTESSLRSLTKFQVLGPALCSGLVPVQGWKNRECWRKAEDDLGPGSVRVMALWRAAPVDFASPRFYVTQCY